MVILTGFLLPSTLGDEFTNPSNSNADLTAPADAPNSGVFVWTIGESDNINEEQIAADPDFVLQIHDPSGQTGTGNGFVNGTLQSRAFVITSNVSSSSSSSSLVPTTSTSVSSVLSSATTTSAPKGTSSPPPASGLSIGAKAGIGVGAGIGGIALIALGACLGRIFQHYRNKPQVGRSPPMPSEEKEVVSPYSISQSAMRPIPPHGAANPDNQPSSNQPTGLGDNSVYQESSTATYHEIDDGRGSFGGIGAEAT
jgi:hypothetical protein